MVDWFLTTGLDASLLVGIPLSMRLVRSSLETDIVSMREDGVELSKGEKS